MTTAADSTRERIPPELIAEAGVWVARLHGPDRTAAAESGFRQWLNTSAAHARAFELATEVWEEARNLRRVVGRERSPSRRTALRLTTATAVIALTAITGTYAYLHYAGVSTDIGEQRLLTLEDGSRMFLNTTTRIVVRYTDRERRVVLEKGEALFHVAPRPTWPFVVTVGDQEVRALGTSFVIRRDPGRIAVTLVEGKVAVAAQTLSPGERLTIVESAPPALDRPAIDHVIAWRRGQVVLDNTPLNEAIAEMNRYSAVKLMVERPETANLLVNGLFQAGDSESFARAVAQTYGLQVIAEPRRFLLAGTPSAAPTPLN